MISALFRDKRIILFISIITFGLIDPLERFWIECRKTRTKPISYQLDYSKRNIKTKTKTKVIVWLLSTLNW